MLTERLGFPADARLLIVNCDDLGVNAAVTEGCLIALEHGVATGATLMVPCPGAATAVTAASHLDIGVHLTLTCEWSHVRWGPVTDARSLCRPDGCMFRSVNGLMSSASADEVRSELCAQIEQAYAWGVDVTHLDSHMYALHDHERFFAIYLELAREYGLPVRLSGSTTAPSQFRHSAIDAGVVAPDHLVPLAHMGSADDLTAALRHLPPGVTEFHAHPSLASDLPDSAAREDDLALYLDPGFRTAIEDAGAELISYRMLRDLAREGS